MEICFLSSVMKTAGSFLLYGYFDYVNTIMM